MDARFTPLLEAADTANREGQDYLRRLDYADVIVAAINEVPDNLVGQARVALRRIFPIETVTSFLENAPVTTFNHLLSLIERDPQNGLEDQQTRIRILTLALIQFYYHRDSARTLRDALIFWTVFITAQVHMRVDYFIINELFRLVLIRREVNTYVLRCNGVMALAHVLCSFYPKTMMYGQREDHFMHYESPHDTPHNYQWYFLNKLWTCILCDIVRLEDDFDDLAILNCFRYMNLKLPYFERSRDPSMTANPFYTTWPQIILQNERVIGVGMSHVYVYNIPNPPTINTMVNWNPIYAIYRMRPRLFAWLANHIPHRTLNPSYALITARDMLTRTESTSPRMSRDAANALAAGATGLLPRIARFLEPEPDNGITPCSLKQAMDKLLRRHPVR